MYYLLTPTRFYSFSDPQHPTSNRARRGSVPVAPEKRIPPSQLYPRKLRNGRPVADLELLFHPRTTANHQHNGQEIIPYSLHKSRMCATTHLTS